MFCTECGTPNRAAATFCRSCGFRLDSPTPLSPHSAPVTKVVAVTSAATLHYASFGRRTLACVLDCMVLYGLGFFIGFVLAFAGELMLEPFDSSDLNGLLVFTSAAVGWLYYAGTESSVHQATLGKRAFGIRVTDVSGQRLSFAQATGRFFGRTLSVLTLGIGFVMAALTKRNQALHDLISGCVVVGSDR